MMAGLGRETRRGWETSVERPEINSQIQFNFNVKNNLRNEQSDDHRNSEFTNRNVHDSRTWPLAVSGVSLKSGLISVRSVV